MDYEIKKGRDPWGKLKLVTDLPFAPGKLLRLETGKESFGKNNLSTLAAVFEAPGDGTLTHSFAFMGKGDWSKRYKAEGRGTEKNLLALHNATLAGLEAMMLEAAAHYAARATL